MNAKIWLLGCVALCVGCGTAAHVATKAADVAGDVAEVEVASVDVAETAGADAVDAVADVPEFDSETPDVAPDALPSCVTAACNDGNACTVDSCGPAGCVHATSDGLPCSDGNECTVLDACQGGSCKPGAPAVCDDTLLCTVDACQPGLGCTHVMIEGGCDDGSYCTQDGCDAKTGKCWHDASNLANTLCNADGDPCTIDTCQGGVCKLFEKNDCDDGNLCTTDACVAQVGCQNAWNSAPCELDGDVCTQDFCGGGACKAGPVNGCDDKNLCTLDTCAPKVGCGHVALPDATTCSDGDGCALDGACLAGVCTSAVPKVCAKGLVCAVGSCAPPGMVFIPAGTFWMGCDADTDEACGGEDTPKHKVTLTQAYYLDRNEITVAQYQVCIKAGACTEPVLGTPGSIWTGPMDMPVDGVSRYQARQYCIWRGPGFDVPSEAQWEMAARGDCAKNGSSADDPTCKAAMRTYPWGEATPSCTFAVMADNGKSGCGSEKLPAVGSKPAGDSPYGVHDMIGSVWEWTLDGWSWYGAASQVDPVVPSNPAVANDFPVRGGDWTSDKGLQAWNRGHSGLIGGIGVRCRKFAP